MANIERTAAGLQMVIPGCERRTLPKSTSWAGECGQSLLQFYREPSLREKLRTALRPPCRQKEDKKHSPYPVFSVCSELMSL